MSNRWMIHALLSGAGVLALATPAFAEEQAAPQAAAQADGAADDTGNAIVVTAQNRKQNVNDVPIAIDVVSGDQLKKAGFSDINDIDKIAPVVQLNQDQGTVKISVRGVGTTSGDESQDTSVVVDIDGEYINRPTVLGLSLFDMERVEVLRGPQGTLYGRNSTGGAINFITRKPGNKFAVDASVSYGNYNAVRADGGVDVPLGSRAAVRVSGFYEDRDGYVGSPGQTGFFIFPTFPAYRSDDNHAYGGRISFKADPTDKLSITASADYARRSFSPASYATVNLNAPGNGPTGPGCNSPGYILVAPAYQTAPGYGQTLCAPANTNFLSAVDRSFFPSALYGPSHIAEDSYAVRGRIAYKFSEAATLSYTGGYRSYSGDPTNHLALPDVYQNFSFRDETQTQSHELRLNGTIAGVIYQIGGFYFKERQQRENGFFVGPIAAPAGTYLTYFGRFLSSESKSLFGQFEVPLFDKLTAVGGLRYTDNSRNGLYYNGTPFTTYNSTATAGCPIGTCVIPGPPNFTLLGAGPGRKNLNAINAQIENLRSSENKVTYLAGLNYKPNRDTLLYAKVSTGFKGGGFDAIGTFKPENNTAYEAGWKQTFGDHGQHQFNLGGYYYDYKDLQVSVLLDTTKGGQTFNAGKATIYGFEMSGDFKLDDNTGFHASFNYLHARYDQLAAQYNVFTVQSTAANGNLNGIGDLDPVTPGLQQPNFAGNRPPFSPEYIVTMGLDHTIHLGENSTLTGRVDTTFKSSYFLDFFNYRDGKQGAYSQTNLSLEYKPNRMFSIEGFARNLENTRPLTYGSFIAAGPSDVFNWQFGAPRTYGVRVSVKY